MLNFFYTIIIYPLTQIIEFIFVFSQKVFKETGVSLIFISTAISILCLPLYAVAEKWQETERSIQKRLKTKINKIKAVFRGDEQYMILSAYYSQNKYHPIYAMRSTFGLLIQIPFFIAAYSYLSSLEALKGARFFIISDLSLPDALLSINVLSIVMTLINCIAGAIYTKGFPIKDKLQLYGMAVIFLILLYNSPSGLVLYWTMNNIFSLLKNIYYKISFKYKNNIIYAIISVLCTFMIYYILFIHKGDIRQRSVIALLSAAIGIVPWLLISLKKISKYKIISEQNNRNVFYVFILCFSTLWVLTGLCIPAMLIVSSTQEFSYIDTYSSPLFFIYNSALQTFGFFIFWPSCLYFLFSYKIKKIFAFLGLLFCFTAIGNAFGFPGNYGLISINLQFSGSVNHSSLENFLNIGMLCLVIIVILFLFLKKFYKILIPALSFVLIAIFGLSSVNLYAINKEFLQSKEFHADSQPAITSIEPLFNLSVNGKNTVIIMLDRASSSFFPYVLKESPDLNNIFSGFVYYPNTVSFNGYTQIGALPIFGGYEYIPEEVNKRNSEPLVNKHNEALLMLPRLFSEAGYSVTVTDPPYPNYSSRDDLRIYNQYPLIKAFITDTSYTDFWLNEHNINLPLTSDILKRNIFWYGLFKISPLAIRRGIYQYGDWCSPISGQKLRLLLNGYSVLDYLPRLTNLTNDNKNTLLLMVNNTTHEGSFLQAPEYRPAINITNYGTSPFNKETEYHINIAAYKRLADWFAYLKNENVYDNTRIILVSDHGSQISYVTKAKNGMPQNFDNLHPMLLFKDFGASGDLQTDMAFMTNADVPYLALDGQIDKLINPFTGNEISTESKKQALYIAVSGSVHLENPNTTQFTLNPKNDYYVHDNIFEEKNWTKAE